MGLFDFDPGEKSLGELGTLNDRLTEKVKSENKAARGTGGVGANKFDDAARDASRQQVAVETEIQDRLFERHDDRSRMAQRVDENRKAPIADDPEQWAENPGQFDWPGVDTPR